MSDKSAALIDRLLKSGKISADTREDLETYREDLAEGELDQADRRYIQALAERVLGEGGAASTADADAEDEEAYDEEEVDEELIEELESWQARAEEAEAEVEELRARVEELEAEVARLQEALDSDGDAEEPKPSPGGTA